jgi:hypothetical protein
METRGAKRIKLQIKEEEEIHRESSIDPLIKVCPDLHELILQHFSGNEVLVLSLVSPEWSETIQRSIKCMSKIQLKLEENVSEAKQTLMKSNRKYSSLLVRSEEESQPIDVYQLLKKFAPNLVNLTIPEIEKLKSIVKPKIIDFSKLESFISDENLTYFGCMTVYVRHPDPYPAPALKYFANCTQLKKLTIGTHTNFAEETLNWIQKQTQLKELYLETRSAKFFEGDFLANCQFKLTKLKCDGPRSDAGIVNFNDFLLRMAETLTFLSVGNFFGGNCPKECLETIINRLPNLKTFHCACRNYISGLKFAPNKSITEIRFRCSDNPAPNLFKSLMNVEILYTNKIDENGFEWIFRKMKMKKFAYLDYYGGSSEPVFKKISDSYESLKETDVPINRGIELLSGNWRQLAE